MEPTAKKLTFGFSKIIKKPNLLPQNGAAAVKETKIQMIDSIEGLSIKVAGKDANDELIEKLVIPMTNDQKSTPLTKLMEDRKQIAKNRGIKREIKTEPAEQTKDKEIKQEPVDETLEQQAARELIEDLQEKLVKNEVKVFEVPINPDELPLEGAKESSLDDYDRVPINDFGKAMLRGMGWKEEEKDDSKKLDLDGPILRPKGMGLGADKVIKKQPLLVAPNQSETLEIKRHACVKVLAGKHKNFYGTIEGFDDGGGRVVVKMAIGGLKVTINEFMVQPVAKAEFAKFGKIINSEKFEEYKSGDGNKNSSSASTSRKDTEDKKPRRSRSIERQRRDSRDESRNREKFRNQERSRSREVDRRRDHKSKDKRHDVDRKEASSKSRKYHGRSRSREKKSRRTSSSSDDYRSKKKSSKRKHNSSPETVDSSDQEKKHKKKTKKSKHKRDRS